MDFSDPHQRAVFFDVHTDLPREGPGDTATMKRALEIIGDLPQAPRILDIGCGPGGQTIDLAKMLPDAKIVALDLHEPFLERLKTQAKHNGFDTRIHVERGNMGALSPDLGTFDLIWCEGAAYNIGVAKALQTWRAVLKPGGRIALSELVWLRDDPPDPVRQFFANDYPGMMTVDQCRQLAVDTGYSLEGDFVLPEEAWWTNYYTPMEARVLRLLTQYQDDDVALSVVKECADEIEMYRQYSAYYGYVFLVVRPEPAQR